MAEVFGFVARPEVSMTDSHAIAVPWFGGFIAFDSNEPGRDIEAVLDA